MKYQIAAVLALATGANAFVTPSLPLRVHHAASSSATSLKMTEDDGPLALPMFPRAPTLDKTYPGDFGFDPFGLSNIKSVPEWDIYWMREAEVKHCRISMLAVVGVLWCDQVGSLPGMPSGTNQIKLFSQVWEQQPWIVVAIVVGMSIVEYSTWGPINEAQENGGREPGDFGLDPFDIANDPEAKERYQLNEVKNGRLAMIAIAGMFVQGMISDQSALQNLLDQFPQG
ncbi:unnamed protein product [Ascophyllum nodosum]